MGKEGETRENKSCLSILALRCRGKYSSGCPGGVSYFSTSTQKRLTPTAMLAVSAALRILRAVPPIQFSGGWGAGALDFSHPPVSTEKLSEHFVGVPFTAVCCPLLPAPRDPSAFLHGASHPHPPCPFTAHCQQGTQEPSDPIAFPLSTLPWLSILLRKGQVHPSS